MGWGRLLWLAGMLAGGPAGDLPADPGRFGRWFAAGVEGTLDVPSPIARRAAGFRYVFVGGFRNERMPGYFAGNIAEMKRLGIDRRRMHVILPSSKQTTADNAREVRDRFLAIAEEGPERLVVVAHSRGACDALAFALENSAFVRDRVEAFYLIQGPFGGSGLASYLGGSGEPIDRRMPWPQRAVAHLAKTLARFAPGRRKRESIASMTPETSAAFWASALDREPETLAIVGSRTFYIQAAIDPDRLGFVRRALAWYLQIYHGRGDGVVTLEAQSLPRFGKVLATVEAGHSDLTCKRPSSRAHRRDRVALMESLVMDLGSRERAEPSSIRIEPSEPGDGGLDLGEHAVPERQSRLQRHRRGEAGVSPSHGIVAADR